jgi:4-diphosphocytidyl-2-C-methyl-D-erythritol kinase
LFFEKSDGSGIQLTCSQHPAAVTDGSNLAVPVDETNLCWRAYQLVCEAAQRRLGVRLHLEKKIPTGAGLGGGSSDAAITLIALNRFFALNLPDHLLYELAVQLGSDVPFFLTGGLCYGRGRGEIITPLPEVPDFAILLITPSVVVSTAWAYQKYKLGLTNRQKNSTLSGFNFSQFSDDRLGEVCQNDLETGVFQYYPELASIKERLQRRGALVASMTGSGSAVYGIFLTQHQAESSRQIFQKDYATYVTKPVRWGLKQVYQDYAALTSGG